MKRAVSLGPSFTVLVAIGCWMLSSRLADGGLHELGDADKQAGSLMNDPEETADGDASYDPEKADSNTEEATEAGEKKSQAMEVATKKAEADHAAAFRAREAQEMARVAAAAKARTDAASKETGEKEVHAKAQPPTNQDPTIQNPWALPAERKQPKTNQGGRCTLSSGLTR